MKGVSLRLPYLDSSEETPSQKTDFLVEQTFTNVHTDPDIGDVPDIRYSLVSMRSVSTLGQDVSKKKLVFENISRLELELKEKNQIIRNLQNSNKELRKIIKEIQCEK